MLLLIYAWGFSKEYLTPAWAAKFITIVGLYESKSILILSASARSIYENGIPFFERISSLAFFNLGS